MIRIEPARHRLLMTPAWVVLALLVGAVPCVAQDPPDVAPALAVDSDERRRGSPTRGEGEGGDPKPVASDQALLHKYVWSTLGPEGVFRAALKSGLDQWRESPPEWGTGGTGYAKRWASNYAESAIGNTAKYTVARIFHHDPSFTVCECSGFARRLRHAVTSPFMARKQDGKRVLSAASLAGFLTGRVVSSSTWYPAPHGTLDGLKDGGVSLLSTIGMDVVKEFRPRRPK